MRNEILKLAEPNQYTSPRDMYDALNSIYALVSASKNRMVETFIKAFETAQRKSWDRIYISVDIHETILKPTWSKELSSEYYEFAKETLQLMSNNKMICLILWSCSLPEFNKQYKEFFEKDGIIFDYINSNPECPSTEYANFDDKLYFSVGIDDKFGFNVSDWIELYIYLKSIEPVNY